MSERTNSAASRRSSSRGCLYILVTGCVAAVTLIVLLFYWTNGDYGRSDWPRIREAFGRYPLPDTIPEEATGVRIHSDSMAPSLLESPDRDLEVRYILPREKATQLLAQCRSAAANVPNQKLATTWVPRCLSRHASPSGLPLAFESMILYSSTGGSMQLGVTINRDTGEVVYWVYDS